MRTISSFAMDENFQFSLSFFHYRSQIAMLAGEYLEPADLPEVMRASWRFPRFPCFFWWMSFSSI